MLLTSVIIIYYYEIMNNSELLKLAGTEDYRGLAEMIYNWSNNTDFTGYGIVLKSEKKFYRAFIISRFYELPKPVFGITELIKYEPLTVKEREEIRNWFFKIDV